MRRLLRTSLLATAAIAAVVAIYITLTLPPSAVVLTGSAPANQVIGAYHIHTTRSDGSGTVDEVARAASAARLAFVILTDHGDGTRAPDPPVYRHGVLCIDGVEINSTDGHIVALGLTAASPYPLAGPARDVIEDIHRLGGQAVLAHPDSPKAELRFRAQNVPFDGIEWLNVDSEWRDETRGIVGAAVRGLVRPAESITTLMSRPARTFQRWDAAARIRPVFGMAALDAHARIGWREDGEPRQRTAFKRPTYEAMFRTIVQSVALDAPLSGNAVTDAAQVLGAIAAGHSFSVVRALAFPATLAFTGTTGDATILMGGRLDTNQGPVSLRAVVPEAPGARVVLLHNGREALAGRGEIRHTTAQPGVYRIEVFFPGATVPWLVSNPIVVSGPGGPGAPGGRGRFGGPGQGRGGAPGPEAPLVPLTTQSWIVERDAASSGSIGGDAARPEFAFELGQGAPVAQYAALVAPLQMTSGVSRIAFSARASRPMRLSVQVRLSGGTGGQRWRRSVYVDETPRQILLRLEDFEPADGPTTLRPISAPLQSLLFVVDLVNATPGSAGTIWLSDLAVGLVDAPAPLPDDSRPRG